MSLVETLNLLQDAVASGTTEIIVGAIDLLPFGAMTPETFDSCLFSLLSITASNDNDSLAKLIVDEFSKRNIQESYVSTLRLYLRY